MKKPSYSMRRGRHLRRAIALSLAIAAVSLPAFASDGATSVRLPDSIRFPESVTSDANGTLFVSLGLQESPEGGQAARG